MTYQESLFFGLIIPRGSLFCSLTISPAQRVWGRDRAAPCNHNFRHNENYNEKNRKACQKLKTDIL